MESKLGNLNQLGNKFHHASHEDDPFSDSVMTPISTQQLDMLERYQRSGQEGAKLLGGLQNQIMGAYTVLSCAERCLASDAHDCPSCQPWIASCILYHILGYLTGSRGC
jgi:hypothetical protein